MIEKLIGIASGLVTIFTAFAKKSNNFFEVTVAGGTFLQPDSEKKIINKNEVISVENVSWGEVGKAVINLRNGDSINVEETKGEICKKLR